LRQEAHRHVVSTKKASGTERSGARNRSARSREAAAAARAAARNRGHSLAPEHLGEVGSAAVLAMSIVGLAVFIGGIAMVVFGMTTAARYGSTPPPNADALGQGQVIGGIAVAVLGVALLGAALAVLADLRRSRVIATGIAALAAVLAAIGVWRVTTLDSGDPILAGALAVGALVLAAAAFILARRAR
jgi:hypothetical protein